MRLFLEQINQNEKTLAFCATQDHALAVRDLVNQMKTSQNPNYCQRVTANDGAPGEQHLREPITWTRPVATQFQNLREPPPDSDEPG